MRIELVAFQDMNDCRLSTSMKVLNACNLFFSNLRFFIRVVIDESSMLMIILLHFWSEKWPVVIFLKLLALKHKLRRHESYVD